MWMNKGRVKNAMITCKVTVQDIPWAENAWAVDLTE
jgi:hypothetical protein